MKREGWDEERVCLVFEEKWERQRKRGVSLSEDVFLRLISVVRGGPLQPGRLGLSESCTSASLDRLSPFLPDLSLRSQTASLLSS